MKLSITSFEDLPAFAVQGVTHMVSIGDPDLPAPDLRAFYGPDRHLRSVLRLHFHDLDCTTPDRPGVRPAALDMERLIRWARGFSADEEREAHVLFHCFGGRYRSSTAAWLFLIARGMEPTAAWNVVLKARPCGSFNQLMVQLAEPLILATGLADFAAQYVACKSVTVEL